MFEVHLCNAQGSSYEYTKHATEGEAIMQLQLLSSWKRGDYPSGGPSRIQVMDEWGRVIVDRTK